MIVLYLRWIAEGRLTLQAVPARWREAVAAALEEETAHAEP